MAKVENNPESRALSAAIPGIAHDIIRHFQRDLSSSLSLSLSRLRLFIKKASRRRLDDKPAPVGAINLRIGIH